jgi:hypothetical protein
VTSPAEPQPTERLVAALRRHPLAAMTVTELAARTRPLPADQFTEELATLRTRRVVVTHTVPTPDPHLPSIEAVALVLPPTGTEPNAPTEPVADAGRRAAQCAQVLQRQLLRSHRCQ